VGNEEVLHHEEFVGRPFDSRVSHQPLSHGRGRHQKGAGDLRRRQAADHSKRQRDPRFGAAQRMAAREHQPEPVEAKVVVHRWLRCDDLRPSSPAEAPIGTSPVTNNTNSDILIPSG
jgi:hypothetical protein